MGPNERSSSISSSSSREKKNNNEYFERLISLFFLQIAFTSTRKLCAPLYFSWRSFSTSSSICLYVAALRRSLLLEILYQSGVTVCRWLFCCHGSICEREERKKRGIILIDTVLFWDDWC